MALCLWGAAFSASAQDVTLTSRDKSIEISGNLLGFDGTYYRVETVYGELTVDGSGVLCEGPACPNLEAFVAEMTFSGTPAIGRVLLPALIEGFARQAGYEVTRSDISDTRVLYDFWSSEANALVGVFSVHMTSNDEGFADVLSNGADVAMSLRPVWEEEVVLSQEAGFGDLTGAAQHDVVALDALVPSVARELALAELTVEQIAALLGGQVTTWDALGEAEPAVLTVSLTGAQRDILQPVLDALSDYGHADVATGALSDERGNGLAVDFERFSARDQERRAVSIADTCGIIHAAGEQAIKSLEYPFTLPMYLYRPMRRLPKIGQDFFDYIDGPSARRVVERAGFVAMDASETSIEVQGHRLANAVALIGPEDLPMLQAAVAQLKDRRLLSLTFRFDGDGAVYDANSSTSMKRLVRLADAGVLDGKSVLFAGFGDTEGLAAKVAADFQEAFPVDPDLVQISTVDLGDTLPLACAETTRGQMLNRRVEVWLR